MKITNLKDLKTVVENYKLQGKKIVWTNGCFDLLHPGHLHSLKKAKEQGDILIVGLDSDISIKKLKGQNRPIITEEHRAKSLASLEFIDHVIIFNFGEAKTIINELKPHIYVKSGNYDLETINQEERKIVEEYGGEIYLPKGLEGFSTTDIIKKINSNKISMDQNLFDRNNLIFKPLMERESKTGLDSIIDPDAIPKNSQNLERITATAKQILKAKNNGKSVILAFGAHLVKNGLSLVLGKLVEEGYVTHLATNGAAPIHDWELAFQGITEEDVRKYVGEGQFGIWEETGKYLNLAIIAGAASETGYGQSIASMIHKGRIDLPENLPERTVKKLKLKNIFSGQTINLEHPNKNYSFQNAVFKSNAEYTVHPHIGHDIIYTHPLSDGGSIGVAAEIDFLKFTKSISNLEGGGVYLSVGSAIMSPMVFEKSLSMARNLAQQKNQKIDDFLIVVNDIQKGEWDWSSSKEPTKDDPAYYLRFCKTFHRIGAKEMYYIQEDNRVFLTNLYNKLKGLEEQDTNL